MTQFRFKTDKQYFYQYYLQGNVSKLCSIFYISDTYEKYSFLPFDSSTQKRQKLIIKEYNSINQCNINMTHAEYNQQKEISNIIQCKCKQSSFI